MKGLMNTQLGAVVIDSEVIAQYAGSVAIECFGIVGMAMVNVKDGLVKLELAVAKGKKLYDKRSDIAGRDAKREMERRLKEARFR